MCENGVWVGIFIGKYGSRPKSIMNRLQCQVKKFNFILVGSYSWISSSVLDLLLLLAIGPSGSHSFWTWAIAPW